MAKYVVIYEDERAGALPPDLLTAHVEHLQDLRSRGILFMCGPLKDSDGMALLILEADSQEEVEGYVLKDPFIVEKWYANHRIYEWIEANENNNYLLDTDA